MQVSMSLTQETVDKLDALEKKIGATSRSDAVRLLVTLANEPRKGLIGIDDLSERLTTMQGKLDAILAAVKPAPSPMTMGLVKSIGKSFADKAIDAVEDTKQTVKTLPGKHKTYFKKALT